MATAYEQREKKDSTCIEQGELRRSLESHQVTGERIEGTADDGRPTVNVKMPNGSVKGNKMHRSLYDANTGTYTRTE